jgi:hypothetical protein
MIDARAVQSQAEAHRRDLLTSAGLRRVAREDGRRSGHRRATQRSAAGVPVTGGRAVRRSVAPRVGTWLIEFGTRLGGASVRAS